MEKEDFKIGDKVRIKKFERRPEGWNPQGEMDKWMGKEVTVHTVSPSTICIEEDPSWAFNLSDFEPIHNTSDSNEVLICHK